VARNNGSNRAAQGDDAMNFDILIRGRMGVMAVILAALLLPANRAAAGKDNREREAAKAYEQAYELVLGQQYSKANRQLAAFLEKYRDSRWYDDARYWYCYSLMRSTNDLKRAFTCFHDFIQEYPSSVWNEDAKDQAVIIGRKLAKTNPEYRKYLAELRPGDADELDQYLIMKLIENGDEEAIVDLLDRVTDTDLRRKLVYGLEDCRSERCKEKLIEIAKTDKDADVRRRAVYTLSEVEEDSAVVQLMVQIMRSEEDPDIRRHAMYVIAESDDPAVVDALSEIAMNEKDVDMRRAATYALAESDDERSTEALKHLARESEDPDVKRAALYGLVDREEVSAVGTMKEIAITSTDPDLRRAAVWAIADMEDERAAAEALGEIFKASGDFEVKKAALHGLAEHDDEELSARMLKDAALGADDEELAKTAVYALRDVVEDEDVSLLLEVYENSQFNEVRRAALLVILDAGGDEALAAVKIVMKKEPDPELRLLAVWALDDVDDEAAAVAILSDVARNDPNKRVRLAAVQVLGNIDTDEANDVLMELIKQRSKKDSD
jgi:HEAT repeat protein